MYASRKDELEMAASVRTCLSERVVRFVKALEALEADGRVNSVGRVSVLSVYDSPYSKSR